MKGMLFVVLFGFALSGCGKAANEQQVTPSLAMVDGACKFIGNDPNRHYCATTFIQLLANPERYDGQLIYLQGWATHGEGHTILFPSQDAIYGVETQASIVLMSGPELDEIGNHITRYASDGQPVRISVGGRFSLNRRVSGNKMKLTGYNFARFGAFDEVDKFEY